MDLSEAAAPRSRGRDSASKLAVALPIALALAGGVAPGASERPSAPDYDAAFARGLPIAEDPHYGVSEEEPIRIGGRRTRTLYLLSLRGPEGQRVRYERLGSCCHQEGGGVLDVFELWHRGLEAPIQVFFDIYRDSEPRVPRGFTFRRTEEPNWTQWMHSWLHTTRRYEWNPQESRPRPGNEAARQERAAAWEACRTLAGYEVLRRSFEIGSAKLGSINLMPEALFVSVRSTSRGLVNNVWWWNLLEEGRPRYDWRDFLRLHREASALVSAHGWLGSWRESGPGRILELHALGTGIGETRDDLDTFVLPVWRDAGFGGEPSLSVLARRPNGGWARLYFGAEETRAMVTAVQFPDLVSGHWLDAQPVYFHPRCEPDDKTSRYVVVERSGAFEVRAFSDCLP